MHELIRNILLESRQKLDLFLGSQDNIDRLVRASGLFINCLRDGNGIYSCGNGGSMSDAMHFAEELTGRYRRNRAALPATAISDPGHISCVANDFGYDKIFSRYLEARARPGDCLLAISTSGKSPNVIAAAEYARSNGLSLVSLTGRPGSELGRLADVDIAVGESAFADRIQELHIKVIHILIEMIERDLFPENYQG